ncbi:MAG: hypothetical protein JWL97_3812 [Gemmatimonadales bacterium]|nr:hypothetical protein [Gemmatimonadales bacterium]
MAYYNVRDLLGHFVRGKGHRKCPHKCCQGRRPHPADVPLLPNRDVVRAMSTEQINKLIDWDDDESVLTFLAELNRREKQADAKRSAAERRKAKAAREREEHYLAVHNAHEQAENETRGHMLSPAGRAAGVHPRTLFTGPRARADKYASEELRNWWDEHGRMTVTDYRRHLASERESYEAADRSRRARSRRRPPKRNR